MKTTKKHFKIFEKWCWHYIEKFGLNEYEIFIEHDKCDDGRAFCGINPISKAFTLGLALEWEDSINNQELRMTAKHEVIHGLVGKLDSYGCARYITKDDMTEAVEELVQRLMRIIPD
jgi:hypothetical protein